MMSSQLDDMADEFPMNPFMTDSNLNNNNNNNNNMNMGTMNTPVPAFAQQPSMMQNQNVQQQQQFQPPTLEQPPPFVPPSSDLNSSSTTFSGNMDNNNNNGGGMTVPVPKCCSFETYARYFNVDTIDIKTRIIGAIQFANIPDHFRNNILNQEGKGPDLYGPTWITMTLVFFVAVTSNVSKYFHSNHASNFEYDISHLFHAMWILNCFVFGLPLVNYLLFKCVNVTSVSLVELISLYGYSMVAFFPATVLCMIPVEALEWIFLLAATAVSAILILRNVARPILETSSNQQRAGPILIFIMVAHVIFYLVLKFTFYYHSNKNYHTDAQDQAADVVPTTSPTAYYSEDSGDISGDGSDRF